MSFERDGDCGIELDIGVKKGVQQTSMNREIKKEDIRGLQCGKD